MATFFWDVLALFLSLTLIWTSSFLITGISFDGTQGVPPTWGNLVLDDLFLQLTRALCCSHFQTFLLQAPAFTTFGEGKPCPNSHTILTMAHHTLLKIHVVAFDIPPCLSLSDTYFFPLLLPAQMMISCTSCGCWGFSLRPWIWGFLKILHYLCFVVKIVMFFTLLPRLSFLMVICC